MSDDLLFREVDEDVRQEQYKKLWDQYGYAFVALCVAVVLAVAGYKGWQYWQLQQAESAAVRFFAASDLSRGGKLDDALREYAAVSQSGYAQLAKFREASVLAEQGKTEDAVKIYQELSTSASDQSLRDLAAIRSGLLQAETLKPDEIKAKFGSFDVAGNPWRHAVREMLMLSAWNNKDTALADTTVKQILGDTETPPGLRQRAQIISILLAPMLEKK